MSEGMGATMFILISSPAVGQLQRHNYANNNEGLLYAADTFTMAQKKASTLIILNVLGVLYTNKQTWNMQAEQSNADILWPA